MIALFTYFLPTFVLRNNMRVIRVYATYCPKIPTAFINEYNDMALALCM